MADWGGRTPRVRPEQCTDRPASPARRARRRVIGLRALFTSNPVRTMAIDYLKKILTAKVYDVAVRIFLR